MGKIKNLLPDQAEPGARCPMADCTGTLDVGTTKNCSCHISAPCGACMNTPLVCNACHAEFPCDPN